MKLPKLLPKVPTKDIRLTLKPEEAIALHIILEQATTVFDSEAEKLNTQTAREIADVVWDLEGKLSDKLHFIAVD